MNWFRRISIGYLLVQAIGVLGWWLALLCWPDVRNLFKANSAPDSTLMAFLIPDLVFFIVGSVLCAYGIAARRPWTFCALYALTGAAVFAGLYCWGLVIVTGGDGTLGALLMSPPMFVPLIIALVHGRMGDRSCSGS